jgi:signal transduction histidine kinase
VLAQVGEPAGEEVAVPLTNHRGTIGQLVVTARPGERLDGRTRASLDDLAPVVANTVQLAATTRALARSRRRLADARDEERRALRRELHDGLGPALAGVNLGLQAARNQLAKDPAVAAELLERISAELDGRIEEVRGLARGLLPPALGELGLEPALAELAERYAVAGLDVRLAVDADDMPHVPPDVANTVYAIVSEAVRNVHRHAGARHCEVRVGLDGGLVVSVTDDGAGVTPGAPQGIGLTSMRERAEGLGGTFTVSGNGDGDGDGRPSAGTRVEVRVPRDALAVAG